jgi:hypothetical protein
MNDIDADDQAARHQDELLLQQQIMDALAASLVRPLSMDEAHLLGWASGCATDFNQEIHK